MLNRWLLFRNVCNGFKSIGKTGYTVNIKQKKTEEEINNGQSIHGHQHPGQRQTKLKKTQHRQIKNGQHGHHQQLTQHGHHQKLTQHGHHQNLTQHGHHQKLTQHGHHQRLTQHGHHQKLTQHGHHQQLTHLCYLCWFACGGVRQDEYLAGFL